MTGICLNLECFPVQIGGYTGHIHIRRLQLSKKLPLLKVVEAVKCHSLKWINTLDESLANSLPAKWLRCFFGGSAGHRSRGAIYP